MTEDKFWKNIGKPGGNGCMNWLRGLNQSGYGQVWLNGQKWYTHRLVWTLKKGRIPDGMCVLHRCDNPRCCNLEHLFIGTRLDNARDAVSKGRMSVGERCPIAKLTKEVVLHIRKLATLGYNWSELSDIFNVTKMTVHKAAFGNTWRHIPGKVTFEEVHNSRLRYKRLSNKQLNTIFLLSNFGWKQKDIAILFNVHYSAISLILSGKRHEKLTTV